MHRRMVAVTYNALDTPSGEGVFVLGRQVRPVQSHGPGGIPGESLGSTGLFCNWDLPNSPPGSEISPGTSLETVAGDFSVGREVARPHSNREVCGRSD
jgi:hypothetical protein